MFLGNIAPLVGDPYLQTSYQPASFMSGGDPLFLLSGADPLAALNQQSGVFNPNFGYAAAQLGQEPLSEPMGMPDADAQQSLLTRILGG